MNNLISWFQMRYPELVKDMRDSTHHLLEGELEGYGSTLNPYHLEGTVFEHTLLVCKQAEKENKLVKIAALLHDIGKPDTRMVNPRNGRVSFFNHDAVSAFKSIEILNHPYLGLTDSEKSHIFNLLALHTQVFKQTPEQLKDLFIGQQALADDFIRLGVADSNGRFTSVPSLTLSEYINVNQKEVVSKNKEVIIMCGLPGSGKSTWKYPFNHEGSYMTVTRDGAVLALGKGDTYNEKWETADQKEVDRFLQEQFKIAKTQDTVVVDMTHMSKKSRRRSLSHFDSSYKKTCVVILKDLPTTYLQNDKRVGKVIDRKVIKHMMTSFYPPMLDQFDEIKYIF